MKTDPDYIKCRICENEIRKGNNYCEWCGADVGTKKKITQKTIAMSKELELARGELEQARRAKDADVARLREFNKRLAREVNEARKLAKEWRDWHMTCIKSQWDKVSFPQEMPCIKLPWEEEV